MNRQKAIELVKIINLLLEHSDMKMIRSNFLKAFKTYNKETPTGKRLFGNYRLGGTISMRPSSSKPNLLNIPSTGSTFAKPIKECFGAPKGRLMVGADYTGLEAVVGALISKDENMLKPYTEGFDGHSLRCLAFFPKDVQPVVDKLKEVEDGDLFFIDDSISGIDQFIVKNR